MHSSDDRQDLLEQLGESGRAHLASLGKRTRARKGQIIISHRSEGRDVYFILSGTFKVLLYSRTGKEVWLRSIGAGDCFGELSILSGRPRNANVVAESNGDLIALSEAAFRELLRSNEKAAFWFLQRMAIRIGDLSDRVFEISALDVRNRLYCELLRLALEGERAGDVFTIAPAPSHQEIAARIGSQREAVTREMRDLNARGLIASSRKSLRILNLASLSQLVSRAHGVDNSISVRTLPAPRPKAVAGK